MEIPISTNIKPTLISGRQPWPAMNSLLYLDLDHNELGDSITGGRFDNLIVLGTLKMRYNNISTPPWEALRALRSMQKLYLDGNLVSSELFLCSSPYHFF
jgi:Leucine-rich repeat (LRR) protein